MESIEKHCPSCGAPMLIRRNRATNEEFWGCKRWPDCRHTEQLAEATKLLRTGAPTLFDEEPSWN